MLMYLQKVVKQKTVFVCVLKVKYENSRIRIHWSEADPDPHKNVTDPQHCFFDRKETPFKQVRQFCKPVPQ
jgi:hypothetical protein